MQYTKANPLSKLLRLGLKIQEEVTFKHYNYLEEVLNYIRALLPKNVKGKISEDY